MNYFTKCIDAKALASILEREVRKFICRKVITRFEVSREMVFDNGCQFDTDLIQDYCVEYDIQKRFMAFARPQMNGKPSPPTSRS